MLAAIAWASAGEELELELLELLEPGVEKASPWPAAELRLLSVE